MSTYLGAALKRRLYPTVLCYHGCVSRRQDVLTFRESMADVRSHVRTLQRAGYLFVKPSEYAAWQAGSASYDQPVTCLHFDDGLESIELVVPWLIEQGIPCGLALITRRLRRVDPEGDFLRWEQISAWVASGLVEIINHTHNLHHLTLVRDADGNLDVAPVLEGPCWIDDGDVVYRPASDTRWYWDFSQLDEIAMAVPLWGTDQYDGTSPITTTLHLTPKASGTVTTLRLWMALSRPYGGGYDAEVEIRKGGSLVWAGTIAPKQYATRAQWVEREFHSIDLDTPFAITSGTAIDLEFTTLNAGSALALVYAIPTSDDADFYAESTCQGLFAAGTAGDRAWQYIDYLPGERYPMMPCVILAFGTGADATVPQYTGYVDADCAAFEDAVATWLNASWDPTVVWVTDSVLTGTPIGWSNPSRVDAVLPIASPETITVEALRFTLGGTENFVGGDADEWTYGRPGNPNFQAAVAEALGRSYTACFRLSIGDTATGPWTEIGRGQVYEWQRGRASDVEAFVLTAGVTRYLHVETINGGWLSGPEQNCRWPLLQVVALSRATGALPADDVTQIAYPFGSYYASGTGIVQQRPGFKDIDADLKALLDGRGYTHGYTIQGYRNTQAADFREPDLRQTEWALGRWIVYGDQAYGVSQNNLAALSGFLFHDVPHRGVAWQASLEADPQGNASVRARPQVLDFVAFDAWGFDGVGGIEPFAINDGGTYDGETYADDKTWLQARGVRCLLIINNNLGTGEPDADIASHVVNNPATYVPLIVDVAVDDGWDGITCNLEAVPAADRAAATDFYAQLARAMHAAGKILHATVPAPTGTDYDADWWVGWCDHGAIVKVCDAIKVMSYTESGPGTDPGPAAPQWFWDAVYARIRQLVPEPYWPRVLCGCRSFGHRWADGGAEYITYHQGIAQALDLARRIDVRDTEAGWGNASAQAWFGTPATVDRAQIEAAASFGGIGLWKLDDGDIDEFIPAVRQLGRDEDMSFLDTRFPITISRGSVGGPEFSTSVVESQSGDEQRNARRSLPLCRYDAAVGVRTQAQADELRDLFMVARGRQHTFRYRDWQDYQLPEQTIGTADGVITTFQLAKTYTVGAYTLTRPLTLPVDGTLVVKRNGSVVGGWTCNYSTGLISFASPPAAGVISASCEFDVQTRFDIDYFPTEIVSRNGGGLLFEPGSIPIVERRA